MHDSPRISPTYVRNDYQLSSRAGDATCHASIADTTAAAQPGSYDPSEPTTISQSPSLSAFVDENALVHCAQDNTQEDVIQHHVKDLQSVLKVDDVWSTAFLDALSERSPDEQSKICASSSMKSLLKDVQTSDDKRHEAWYYSKGLKYVRPWIYRLNFLLDTTSSLSNIHWETASAFAIAKTVTQVRVRHDM